MAKPSRLVLAKNDILSTFAKTPQKIYSQAQLASVLSQNRRSWRLADHTTSSDFISFLTKHGNLRARKFRSETYGQEITRYSWGEAALLELVISIKSRAYLCHATALMLHGLAKLSPKTIYLNVEQSAKPSSHGSLTQDGINRAFSGKQRQSNLIYNCNGVSVIMIAGKNTNRLGVEEIAGPESEALQVTNLERTLIDIVVRPAYAGGMPQVCKAYSAARDRMSLDRLLAILKKLDYVYPYHQCIGFLMQKTGHPEKSCAKLRALGLNHDFYLAHGLQQPEYSKDWRLFYPKDFK
jgi:predicted transcriptional regulator of viral defense system